MRTRFVIAGLTLISFVPVSAQEPGRARNPTPSGQTGRANTEASQAQIGNSNADNSQPAGTGRVGLPPGSTKTDVQPGTAITSAQGTDQTIQRSGTSPAGTNAGNLDSLFITWLRGDNRNEVEMAKLAAQQASIPEVRAFAEQMFREHSDFLAKLDRITQSSTPSAGTSPDTGRSEPGSPAVSVRTNETPNRTEVAPVKNQSPIRPEPATPARRAANSDVDQARGTPPGPNRGGVASSARREDSQSGTSAPIVRPDPPARTVPAVRAEPAARSAPAQSAPAITPQPATASPVSPPAITTGTSQTIGGIGQVIQVKQELADLCLATSQRELSEKQGIAFDKCYINMQVVAHMHMVDSFNAMNRHASGQMRPLILEGLQTAQHHLHQAKQLAQLVDQAAISAAPAIPASPAGQAPAGQTNPASPARQAIPANPASQAVPASPAGQAPTSQPIPANPADQNPTGEAIPAAPANEAIFAWNSDGTSSKNVANAMRTVKYNGANNYNNISMGSNHPGGCMATLGDGSVRFMAETIDLNRVMLPLASRSGTEVVSEY